MSEGSPAGPADNQAAHSMKAQHSNDEAIEAVTAGEDNSIDRVEGHAAAFEMWTDEDLHARAREVGIDAEGLSRTQLIEKLESY